MFITQPRTRSINQVTLKRFCSRVKLHVYVIAACRRQYFPANLASLRFASPWCLRCGTADMGLMNDLLRHRIHYFGLYVIHQDRNLLKKLMEKHLETCSELKTIVDPHICLKIILVVINCNHGRMLLILNLVRLQHGCRLKLWIDLCCNLWRTWWLIEV